MKVETVRGVSVDRDVVNNLYKFPTWLLRIVKQIPNS